MPKIDIKQLMDNYDHETATPEEREEAEKFLIFLEHEAIKENSLYKVLSELKSKYKEELDSDIS